MDIFEQIKSASGFLVVIINGLPLKIEASLSSPSNYTGRRWWHIERPPALSQTLYSAHKMKNSTERCRDETCLMTTIMASARQRFKIVTRQRGATRARPPSPYTALFLAARVLHWFITMSERARENFISASPNTQVINCPIATEWCANRTALALSLLLMYVRVCKLYDGGMCLMGEYGRPSREFTLLCGSALNI